VKGKDQFLYRAVTMTQDQISASYQRFIDEMTEKAFNDKKAA
jgi:predicted secreted protein